MCAGGACGRVIGVRNARPSGVLLPEARLLVCGKRLGVGGVAAPWLGTVVAHLLRASADRVRDERGNATVAAPAAPVCGEDVP